MRQWTLLLAATSAACSGEPFVGDVSRSQYFEYHDQVQEPLCPTLLASLDLHAQTIGSKVGLTLDSNNPYQYYKFRDFAAFDKSDACPPDSGACATGNAIDAATYFEAHEQAHDYAFRSWGGWSNGLLDEGEAVAMSCEPFYLLEPDQKPTDVVGMLDWRDLIDLSGDSDHGYGAAGFFVTHLANQYGWESVGSLYRKVPRGSSADQMAQAFSEVFPVSIDQAWSDALGATGAAACQRDWQCMATAMAVGEVAFPDCDGDMHRSVDVGASGGGVVLSMGGEVDPLLTLLSCSDPAPTAYTLNAGIGTHPTTHWASLPPGSYTMFGGPLPTYVTLESKFSGPLVNETCASAATVSLDPSGNTYVDFALYAVVDGWMRLAGGGQRYDVVTYGLAWDGLSKGGSVSICSDCSGMTCVPLPFGQESSLTITDKSVVRFHNVRSEPAVTGDQWGHLMFFPTSD